MEGVRVQLAEQRMARKGCSAEGHNIVAGLFLLHRQWMHTAIYKKINRDANNI